MAITCVFRRTDLRILRNFISKIKDIQSRSQYTLTNKWIVIHDFLNFIIEFKNFISKYKMIYYTKDAIYYDKLIEECNNCISKNINLSNLQGKTLIFLNHVSKKYRVYGTVLTMRKPHQIASTSSSNTTGTNDSFVPPL